MSDISAALEPHSCIDAHARYFARCVFLRRKRSSSRQPEKFHELQRETFAFTRAFLSASSSSVCAASNGRHPLFYLLCDFFIVFLTHMHNRLVPMPCTRYRSNADDSTLFNRCCRSMALLNFSPRIRLINQMLLLFFLLALSLSTGKCLSINANMLF